MGVQILLDVHRPVIHFQQLNQKENPPLDTAKNTILQLCVTQDRTLLRIIMKLNHYSQKIKKNKKEKHLDYQEK